MYQILTSFEGDENYEQLYKLLSHHLSEKDRSDIQGYLSNEKLPSLSSDIISKSIFGKDTEISTERLNYLLRSLIGDKSITVAKTAWQEGIVSSVSSKKVIMDLPVTLTDETFVDMEFQQVPQEFVFKRGDIYLSEMQLIQYTKAADQKKGDITYENVQGAVLIFLMKKSPGVFKKYDGDHYIHRFTTMSADTGMSYKTFGTSIYVQLDKCLAQLREGMNGEKEEGTQTDDDMLQVLLSMMADINDPVVKEKAGSYEMTSQIIAEIEKLTQDKEVRKMLLAEKYVAADLNAALHFAAKEAKAEGEEKGEAKHAYKTYKKCLARGYSEEDARDISEYKGD